MQAEMEEFCDKHMLPKKVTGYVLHMAEEVLGTWQMLIYRL